MTAPRVLGLDLSITATGVAHVNGDVETWKMPSAWGDRRLFEVGANLTIALAFNVPDLVVIEDLPTHAQGAGITGMVQGVVRAKLYGAGIPYALVTPATLKKFAVGKGNAGKPDMAVALYKRTNSELEDDNQVDAAWLRYAGLQHLDAPVFHLPADQVDALSKVVWP